MATIFEIIEKGFVESLVSLGDNCQRVFVWYRQRDAVARLIKQRG